MTFDPSAHPELLRSALGLIIVALIAIACWPRRKRAEPYRNTRGLTVEENRERKRLDTIQNIANQFENAFQRTVSDPEFDGLLFVSAVEYGFGELVEVKHKSMARILRIFIGCDEKAEIQIQFNANGSKTDWHFTDADQVLKMCVVYLYEHRPIDMVA